MIMGSIAFPLVSILIAFTAAPAGGPSRAGRQARDREPGRDPPAAARTVAVLLPGGTRIDAEVADEPELRRIGLMHRKSLPPNGGMLLVFPPSEKQGIWMKDCLMALDLLWLDAEGKVLALKESAAPCVQDPCESYAPEVSARYVLEVASGTSSREGLRPGTRLQIISVEPLVGK